MLAVGSQHFLWIRIHGMFSHITRFHKRTRSMGAAIRSESGQNTLEYMLPLGAFVVVFMAAMLVGLPTVISQVAGATCISVDTAADPPATFGSCLVP